MKSSVVCASLVRQSLSIVVPQVRISAEISQTFLGTVHHKVEVYNSPP